MMRRRGLPSFWLVGLGLVGGLFLVLGTGWVRTEPPSLGYDMRILREAALRLRAGEAIYLDPTGDDFYPGSVDLYYGPPAFAVASLPLTLLDDEQTRALAFPLSLLTILAGLGMLAASTRPRLGRDQVAGILIGSLLSFAVAWGSTLGASSILLLLLLALGWIGLSRRSDALAGVALGTAIALRVYPAALLVALLVAGRRAATVSALVTTAAWTILGVVVAGPDATMQYVSLLGALSANGPATGGISPAAAVSALGLPAPLPRLAQFAAIGVGLALLVAGGRSFGPRSAAASLGRSAGPHDLLGWGLAAGGMLLATPVAWDHYLTALLPLVAGLVAVTGRPSLGLIPIGFLPSLAGSIALVLVPLGGAAVQFRRRLQR